MLKLFLTLFSRGSILLLFFFLNACSPSSLHKKQELIAVSYENLSGWNQEDYVQSFSLFSQVCQRFIQMNPNTYLGGPSSKYGTKIGDWLPACHASKWVAANNSSQIKSFFENWLQPYSYPLMYHGKVTGYYEPEIEGSLVKYGPYTIPVYKKPSNLIAYRQTDGRINYGYYKNNKIYPYYTREQINDGALEGENLELVWLKNPIDLFFMQIQGSGRVVLPDGQIIHLGYAGKNGQPYTAIGTVLVQKNIMSSQLVNMSSLKSWLNTHRDQAKFIMNQNKNYVFFRRLENQINAYQGPIGSFGMFLNAGRSVAVDHDWIPMGIPLWLETTLPLPSDFKRHPWTHMVFAQDLGGNIRGPSRIDLFTGWGRTAEWLAGSMNEKAQIFMFLPKYPSRIEKN
ncbi:hypothetical protein COMNV_01293 [Commensalibacter sp. Nvir]|uniref:murein transglycosylase A n=1 Tax=Commensalibacter sp. Nvir TaxID=3069817 RepID=UPI002D564B46|nr:hypothetical protein COMNV_01293 [Commensalibacter sp. Nvir]